MKNKSSQKSQLVQRYRLRRLAKATEAEQAFEKILTDSGLDYKVERAFFKNKATFCFADFYLGKPYRVVIEIDGEYHLEETQIFKDIEKENYLLSRGYHVIRFSNDMVLNNPDLVKQLLLDFLAQAKAANTEKRLRKDRQKFLSVTYPRVPSSPQPAPEPL